MSNSKINGHIEIKDKRDCCGCTACESRCPVNAICMKEDDEGFLYPYVDINKCVNCGLCLQVCPLAEDNRNSEPLEIYAVKNAREEIREKSTSGGLFSAIARKILDEGGVVYGAAFKDDFTVKHIRADRNSRDKLTGSKYVQSDMQGIYRQVKADLAENKKVLFSGTPCRVDGLNKYLADIDRANLFTTDLICHAVPSPKIWKDYLEYITGNNAEKIMGVNFRSKKTSGWHNSTVRITGCDGEVIIDEKQNENFYYQMFFNHLIIRPGCYKCKYANLNRCGDITIGDYWGVENHYKWFDDDKGVTLAMLNTEKGREMFGDISGKCEFIPVEKEKCLQPPLLNPARPYPGREQFWEAYHSQGLAFAGKRIGLLPKSSADKVKILIFKIKSKLLNRK